MYVLRVSIIYCKPFFTNERSVLIAKFSNDLFLIICLILTAFTSLEWLNYC